MLESVESGAAAVVASAKAIPQHYCTCTIPVYPSTNDYPSTAPNTQPNSWRHSSKILKIEE